MATEGFELNKGFQLKGLMKGTEVSFLVEGEAESPRVDMIGEDTKELEIPLTIAVTKLLGPCIFWLLGFPVCCEDLITGGGGGGEPSWPSVPMIH